MKFSWIALSSLLLIACDATGKRTGDLQGSAGTTDGNGTNKISVVRDINLLPIGDSKLVSRKQDVVEDSFVDLVTVSATLARLDAVVSEPMETPAAPEYLQRIAYIRNNSELQALSSMPNIYQRYRTIWRTESDKLILARSPAQYLDDNGSFERTDLLVLNGEDLVSDGLTVYFNLSNDETHVSQVFFIDANQQIWVRGYQDNENGVALLYAATFVILPSGKIRKIMSEW